MSNNNNKKISELPIYAGAPMPNGDIPISIHGVTYRISPSLLVPPSSGTTPNLTEVTTVGDTITGSGGVTVIDKLGGFIYVSKDDKTSQLVPEGIYLQDGVLQVLFLLGTGGLGIYNTATGQTTIIDPVNGNFLATNTAGSSVGMTVKTDNIFTSNRVPLTSKALSPNSTLPSSGLALNIAEG